MNILITGASQGIGYELGKFLVSQGHTVWGVGRKTIEAPFLYSKCDVSIKADVSAVYHEMEQKNFMPDVIILGAAVFADDLENGLDVNNIETTLRINVLGCVYVIDAFLPLFLKRNDGHFVALSSIAAFRPNEWSVSYPASKAALSLLFRGLDMHYRKSGIPFSNIYLGPVATAMWEGKKSFLVPPPEHVVPKIARIIKTRQRYMFTPFLSTSLFRLLFLIPDMWYTKLSNITKE